MVQRPSRGPGRWALAFPLPYVGGIAVPLKYSARGAFSLATFALDDSAWLWPNARRDRNRFSSLPNNSRHQPAIRSTRSSINSLMRIALTHRYRRTPQANIVTTRVRGMMRASVRPAESFSAIGRPRSDQSIVPAILYPAVFGTTIQPGRFQPSLSRDTGEVAVSGVRIRPMSLSMLRFRH